MSCRILLPLTAAAALLPGCVNEPIGQRDPGLGESVKFNAAIQTINPDPVYAQGSAQPGENGDKAVRAVERYREGEVTPIQTIHTTGGAASGSSP